MRTRSYELRFPDFSPIFGIFLVSFEFSFEVPKYLVRFFLNLTSASPVEKVRILR